jgi:hypothetical protein
MYSILKPNQIDSITLFNTNLESKVFLSAFFFLNQYFIKKEALFESSKELNLNKTRIK